MKDIVANPVTWVVVGAAVLLVSMLAVLIWDGTTPKPDEIDDNDEKARWDELAKGVSDDFGLAKTRDAAGKWAASAAAILAVLSTVAIVAGPSDLVKDVGGAAAWIATSSILAAGGIAALALLLAGTAEQGTPIKSVVGGGQYRAIQRVRASRAALQLTISRVMTAVALILIVGATGVAWFGALEKPDKKDDQLAVVSTSGGVVCGVLSKRSDGLLQVRLKGVTHQLTPGSSVSTIASCPK